MVAAVRRFCHYGTTVCVLAFWLRGSTSLPSDSDPIFSFDPVQQPLSQLQSQQSRTQLTDLRDMDRKATSATDSVNSNATPVDLNICSDTNYRSVDTLPGLRRSAEVRTLQLGQSGVIWPMGNRTIPFNADCLLQLSACAACQILISWNAPSTDIRSLSADPQQSTLVDRDNRGGCETIWDFRDRSRCIDLRLIEMDADQTTLKPYQRISLLNPPPEYRTQFISSVYKLDINLQFWRGDAERASALRQLFPLKYVVIENTKTIRGRPSPTDLPTNSSDGFIASPRFPKTYPEGVTINYTLVNEDSEGTVRLIFTDFRLHYMSILKIIDSNGQEIANTQSQYGISQRPSAIQSIGRTLTVMFTANNYKHEIGFRTNYRFVKEKTWLEQPSPKPCDKVFEDTGGTITIENVNLDAYTYVDCIWILEKPRYAPIGFDKLYLKVEDFSVNSGGKGIQLDLHVGRTSINRRLLSIFGPKSSEQLAREQPQEGFISDNAMQAAVDKAATTTMDEDDSDTGFYLRLRGFLGSASGMDIAFAQFYRWATAICHDMNEFHCDNGRCISNRYQCDAHDHCGDFSDELKCQNRKAEYGAKSRNGMFGVPGDEIETSGLPLGGYTTTILLVAGLIGLTLILLMITIIVARVYRQKLLRRFTASGGGGVNSAGDGDLRDDILSAISASNRSSSTGLVMSMEEQIGSRPGPSLHQVGNRRLLVLPESEIGVLEAPPTYDDALKHPTVPPTAAGTLLRSSRLSSLGIAASPSPDNVFDSGPRSPVGLPDAAGPSSDVASTSFDNPAFEPVLDAARTDDDRRHSRRNRRRRHFRSGGSTCSSSTTSGTDNGGTSGSDTGSDADTASDIDVEKVTRILQRSEHGIGSSRTVPEVDSSLSPIPAAESQLEAATTRVREPANAISRLPEGVRKPPVPLPRSSIAARSATSSQGEPTLSDSTGGFETTTDGLSISSHSRLNDTLV